MTFLDPSERLTLDQTIHHLYLTDNNLIDPFQLHFHPAVPLPITSSGQSHGKEDKEWARRQCSIVWAPMPMSYDFNSSTSTGGSSGKVNFSPIL